MSHNQGLFDLPIRQRCLCQRWLPIHPAGRHRPGRCLLTSPDPSPLLPVELGGFEGAFPFKDPRSSCESRCREPLAEWLLIPSRDASDVDRLAGPVSAGKKLNRRQVERKTQEKTAIHVSSGVGASVSSERRPIYRLQCRRQRESLRRRRVNKLLFGWENEHATHFGHL